MMLIKYRKFLILVSGVVALTMSSICLGEENSTIGCDDASDYGEMARCSIAQHRLADNELNQVYKQLMSYVDETDKVRLRDSQRAWLAYRDKACLFEVGTPGYQTWKMDNAFCEEKLTKQRIEILRYRLGSNQ